jgi:tRNA(Arg) A34 adenosine deaminase TadA
MQHETFVRKAIELAVTSGKKGNDSFGAVLVHNGEVIETAENTSMTGPGFGHAEYNLVIKSAQRFPESVLTECTLYSSTIPCPRCTCAIIATGIKRIVYSVSYESFAKLIPGEYGELSCDEIVRRLERDVEVIGPILEEEGMKAFEYWGGDYRPLEELLEEARRAREGRA